MASKTDVENAIVSILDAVIYPAGDAGASACGVPARIYRGFPSTVTLEPDLAAGIAHVTVFEKAGFTRLASGYMDDLTPLPGVSTLTLTVAGSGVVVGGVPAAGQLAGVKVAGVACAYAVAAADTPATIAAALARLVTGATSSGVVATFPTTAPITAATVAAGASLQTTRRQDQGFTVTIWAPSPAVRDTLADYIDAMLSAARFLSLADGTAARFVWRGTTSNDVTGMDRLWKRELSYIATYGTTISTSAAVMLFGTPTLNAAQAASIAARIIYTPAGNIIALRGGAYLAI